ncbi:MAG: HAD-IIB family hydrolase [Quisquiliibacterium sp.]|jgi:HAD superfamily hydrolase (TIGR01484 family)
MTPIFSAPAATWKNKRFVLLDIDDTLTTDGRLEADSYRALEALHERGFIVIPVTGRPAGWCDMIARFWPVHAVVGENGAFYFSYDHDQRKMHRRHASSQAERSANRKRLDVLAEAILAAVPGAAIASDQAYREVDLAIDFCEDVAPLPPRSVDRIVALFEAAGAIAKVSSIHVNGWFGSHDKLTMTRHLLADLFGCDAEAAREQVVFVGDSPNDAPMFGYFTDAVGVANVEQMRDRCEFLPRWITTGRSGAGFVELAGVLLDSRA